MPYTEAHLNSLTRLEFEALLADLNADYHNYEDQDGKTDKIHLLSDRTYDHLTEVFAKRFGEKYTRIGAPLTRPWQIPRAPPMFLGSLTKVTTQKELDNFARKNPGPYMLSAKIDGASSLFEIDSKHQQHKLTSRGQDGIGQVLDHLIPFLNLPQDDAGTGTVAVRAELVILNSEFKQINDERESEGKEPHAQVRSAVAGVINSQTVNMRRAKAMIPIAYQALDNYEAQSSQVEQFERLERMGFTLPWHQQVDSLVLEDLTRITLKCKEDLDYDIDGMVIMSAGSHPIPPPGKDPTFAVAFKVQAECKETIVRDVVYNVSKHGLVKPIVHVDPVKIGGRLLSYANGKNAGFIRDNKITKGTRLLVTFANEVIPDIIEILETIDGAEMVMPPIACHWNATNKELVVDDVGSNEEQKVQKLVSFFTNLKAKGLGEETLRKVYTRFDGKLVDILSSDTHHYNDLPGLGATSARNIVTAIRKAIIDVPMHRLMAASGCFGMGLGVARFKMILSQYPDVVTWPVRSPEDIEAAVEKIHQVKQFDKLAQQFVEKLSEFQDFLTAHPMISVSAPTTVAPVQAQKREHPDASIIPLPASILFSGFRDENLTARLEQQGVSMPPRFNKQVQLLVVKQTGSGKGKEKEALAAGIPILSLAEFRTKYHL